LYTLAAHPDWAQAIRLEIDAVLESDCLTRESIGKMHKLDSFLRETTRVHSLIGRELAFALILAKPHGPFTSESLTRMTMKPVMFSDGTVVPAGTIVVAATLPQHRDETAFPEADALDPFRFERPPSNTAARKQFTTTDVSYLPFGHGEPQFLRFHCHARAHARRKGKHACPGRFFAGQEIKAMFVHVLTKYEIRTEVEGVRPKDIFMGSTAVPDSKAEILFRQRPV
jgi:hypothetical protein